MTTELPVRFIHAPDLGRPAGYSHAAEVRGGRTVYISGQIALDNHGNVVGADDFEAQARQVFRNLGHVLAAAGLDFGAVVKLTIFLTDMQDIAAFRRVRDEFVNTAAPPASSAVQVAGLVRPELWVEVEAIAVGP
ncbi:MULTISPECIES: RidA family protein [Deinococcus]|uniref:RidA family protein n=1 Tax=Deinococcus rufus TaxID=2136097 RepID=A0ABV7ZCY5_9DEIO|nr:RidA family protein [Deinococcus sp. AB2017081]WQE94958.1 RidA family protein [Deinococcus sp. AB2017081]